MNNPPAFPTGIGLNADKTWIGSGNNGMTLRDYFAAKAMQSWITVTVQRYVHQGKLQIDMPSQDVIATEAYQIADAMLKAREA
jgi:hypothetical protein